MPLQNNEKDFKFSKKGKLWFTKKSNLVNSKLRIAHFGIELLPNLESTLWKVVLGQIQNVLIY